MRRRSKARECALQILYQMDLTHKGFDECMQDYWEGSDTHQINAQERADIRDFTASLVRKVCEQSKAIDEEIERSAEHWSINRMALVDRNVLRIGTCEILYLDDVPSKVAINEAIELAKRFGDAESSKFVNGILDKVAKKHKPCE